MTRVLEGYWRRAWVDRTLGRLGRHREEKRRQRLAGDTSDPGYQRSYLAFPPPPVEVLPTMRVTRPAMATALRTSRHVPKSNGVKLA